MFSGIEIYIYGTLAPDVFRNIRRHVTAYDGDVVTTCATSTTHVIADGIWDDTLATLICTYDHLSVVTPAWVLASIEKKELQDETLYAVGPAEED